MVAREVKLIFSGLVEVPEDVCLNCVVAGTLDSKDAVSPQGARNTVVLQVASDDEDPFAVDDKAAIVKVDGFCCRRSRWKDPIILTWPTECLAAARGKEKKDRNGDPKIGVKNGSIRHVLQGPSAIAFAGKQYDADSLVVLQLQSVRLEC